MNAKEFILNAHNYFLKCKVSKLLCFSDQMSKTQRCLLYYTQEKSKIPKQILPFEKMEQLKVCYFLLNYVANYFANNFS